MRDQKEWQLTHKSLVFHWEGHYIFESNMFIEALCLEEKCCLCPIERGIPQGHEGRVDCSTGRKACLESLAGGTCL